MKKRILMVTSYGFNVRMRNYIEFIVARLLAKHGWEVYAAARSETSKTEREKLNGIRICRTGNSIAGIIFIIQTVLLYRPNVIHVFNLRNNHLSVAAVLCAKLLRIPLVFTEYGLLHDHYLVTDRDDPYPLADKLRLKGPILRLRDIFRDTRWHENLRNYLFHLPLSSADHIAFISHHNLKIAKLLGFNSIYLPHIFDEARWSTIEDHSGHHSKLDVLQDHPGKKFVLFIGQLKLRKGWDIILEAFARLDKQLDAKLVFVTASADHETPELAELIDRLKIRNNIIFLGRVDGGALKRLYRRSDIVAVPSRYEGFGLAVTEAWEIGKPVVASDVPAINEHAVNDVNALLVPPKDPRALATALERLLSDRELSERLIIGGRASFAKLRSEPLANEWLVFYNRVTRK